MKGAKAGYTYITCAALLMLATLVVTAAPQRARTAARLPPISMTCPMHPDVVEDKPGSCPICKMALVPVRLEAAWTCPVHPNVIEHAAGLCPICRRDLIQVTVALTWTCAGHPEINAIEPGRCADGSAMVEKRTLRPHGNHNPQHGGQFFMAPDNWHHLEGTYPRARLFRLYLYDDYARPLPADQIAQVQARLVTKETFDAATHKTTEIAAVPLVRSPNGPYLEAPLGAIALPAEMSAKVKFKRDATEYRFDFTFATTTSDPAPRPVPRKATTGARRPTARAVAPAAAPAAAPPQANLLLPDPRAPIPDATDAIVAELDTSSRQVRALIDAGNFAAVFVPAFRAKDLSIALESRLDAIDPARRPSASLAIEQLVRTAWLLDAVGDVGNRQQLNDAYVTFAAAVKDVTTAFSR